MKLFRWVIGGLLAASVAAGFLGWRTAAELRAANAALRAEIEGLKQQNAAELEGLSKRQGEEVARLRVETQEIQKLRNEVSQLRAGNKEVEKLRAENQRLRTAATSNVEPAVASSPSSAPSADHFSRESWSFAGYATPEAALVSAIWAMREGNPKTYLDSLSPAEQLRMAKVWENKAESEIAAKHQQDVAAISGVRVLERQSVSPDRVLMSIYVEGVRRMEVVSMELVGNEWKFGGFKREAPK